MRFRPEFFLRAPFAMLACASAFALASSEAHAQSQPASGSDQAAVAASSTSASPSSAQADDEARAGDLVRLRIWREPEMSGEFPIDRQGVVVLPRVGPMPVAGRSEREINRTIVDAYRPMLSHSTIEVMVLRRIQVLGAVKNPGLYSMDATMTIGDALALAGGATAEGVPRKIELLRDGRALPVELNIGTRLGDSRVRSGDQIFVPERKFFLRQPGVIGAAITSAAMLGIAIFRH